MTGTSFAVFATSRSSSLGMFAAAARGRSAPVDYAKANRLRLLFFVSLGAILLTLLVLTLPALPYRSNGRLRVALSTPSANRMCSR